MALRICLGKYAKKGYEPEHMGNKVYSIEELCFFIKENAYLLDESFVTSSLGVWIEEECGLKELGDELKRAAKRGSKVVDFVALVLDYALVLSKEEAEEIRQVLLANGSRTVFQKKKARADALLNRDFYQAALNAYRELLNELPEEEKAMEGSLYHGCGVCLAKLFYFTKAGEEFLKAYEITGMIKSYHQYLWTKRLSMGEKDFQEFLRDHKEAYEDSIEIENMLEVLNKQWQNTPTGILAKEIRDKREECMIAEHQSMLKNRIEYLKDSYLERVAPGNK